MEYYGKPADLAYLMQQWGDALLRADGFLQQLDPLTAALVLVDFTWRLAGVRKIDDGLEWNIRPPASHIHSTFRLQVHRTSIAEMRYESGQAELLLNGHQLLKTRSVVRLITSQSGELQCTVGTAADRSLVVLYQTGRPERFLAIAPNATVKFP